MAKKTFMFVCVILFTLNLYASDRIVSYQGRVTDISGTPINDNSVQVTVKFYDAATEGNQVSSFSETHTVSINKGLFSLQIGSKTTGGIPAEIFDGSISIYLTGRS